MRYIFFLVFFSVAYGAKIRIETHIIECEIANTLESRAKGLMGREELLEGCGMLFVYEKAEKLCFWMKNTLIPLSIGFFDDEKVLIKILDMDPPVDEHYIRYKSITPARYALEVPQGWFAKHKIRIGHKFAFLESSDRVE